MLTNDEPLRRAVTETIHKAPPEGRNRTPCCGCTPFELPLSDRMTLDWDLVTCWPAEERREIAGVGASLAEFLASEKGRD